MSNSFETLDPYHAAISRLLDGSADAEDRLMASAYLAAWEGMDDGDSCAPLMSLWRDALVESVAAFADGSITEALDRVQEFEDSAVDT